MTSVQVPSRIAIKRPFAESGDIEPIVDVAGDSVNYLQGFPSIYGVPGSSGGRYVTRANMNAIGNVATNDLFYHKCGGLNTFDAEFAAKVGGYPKGAVLKYLNGTYLYDVISLVDNNKLDFTGAIPTSSQSAAGIVAGSVDNVNWAYCNKEVASSDRILVLETSTPFSPNSSMGTLIGVFKASKNGNIVIEANYDIGTFVKEGTFPSTSPIGFAICIYSLGSSYSTIPTLSTDTINSWGCIYSKPIRYTTYNLRALPNSGSSFSLSINPFTEKLVYGNYYAISALLTNTAFSSTSDTFYAVATTEASGSCKIYIQ